MVMPATALSRNGLQDWLVQRITAIIIVSYVAYFLWFLISTSQLDYMAWRNFFAHPFMRWSTVAVLTSIVLHAWVGLWTVTTDYIHPWSLRLSVQMSIMLVLFGYLIWGLQILWGLE